MPGPLIPKKSGVHRAACFALYRALLRQTFKLPVSQQGKDHFKDQVKKKTRENSRLQGHWNITIALRLGYETLDAVQNEDRRPAVLQRVAELSTPPPRRFQRVSERIPTQGPKPERPSTTRPSSGQHRRAPYNSPVLERPYPTVSGRRHIPKLVNANRIPILRIKKPESRLLGALVRSHVRRREKRLMRSWQLEALTQIGKEEDAWDRTLREEFGLIDQGRSWGDESIRAHNEVRKLHDAAVEKRKRIARQMTIIAEKEKSLAQKERVAMRKKTNVPRRIQLLNRHGREQVAKALAEQTGVGSSDSQCQDVTDETEGNALSAVGS